MARLVQRLLNDEDGQDLVEYALLVGLIAVVAAAGVAAFGIWTDGTFRTLAAQVLAMLT